MNKNWLMSLLVIVFIYQLGFFAVHLPSFLHYLYWGSASILGLVIGFYKCQLIYVHKRLLKGAQNHASSDAKWSFKRYESPTIVITVA